MHILRRNAQHDDLDNDDDNVDPELRLRTVRTAHSTLEESIRTEDRARRRKTMKRKGFFRRGTDKKRAAKAESESVAESNSEPSSAPPVHGLRRNVYVNLPLPPDEQDTHGEPVVRYVRNKVRTSSECFVSPYQPGLTGPQSTPSSRSFPRTCMSSFDGEFTSTNLFPLSHFATLQDREPVLPLARHHSDLPRLRRAIPTNQRAPSTVHSRRDCRQRRDRRLSTLDAR